MIRTHQTPIGDYLIVVDAAGTLTGCYRAGQQHFPSSERLGPEDATVGADVVQQLDEYLAGTRTTFDLDLAPAGTDFQRAVWDQLRTIGYGETITYGKLATKLGRPSATRAVASAVGRNPISIIIPCHRVVGANGALTGYAGGLDAKRWLLDLERRHEM